TIGASAVARAQGDGYTLFMTTSAHTISGHLYTKLNYDPVKDFAPITLVTKVPLVLVVNPAVPATNLQEFLAYLKQDGAAVNFASPGNGTAQHLSGELFKIATQSAITHVPYRGDAPAFTDLAGGQVQMMLATITSALPLIQSGKLRALAVANGKRVQALRDVPTFAEAGMPGFEAATWFGLLAPSSLPPAQAQRIYEDVSKIVATPDMQARIEGLGGEVVNSTPEAFAVFMNQEQEKWGQAVKASGAVAAQ
ncbi:MAG: tripartite tricarboxylate transporter substrate-binding protein, partial [Achromobacter sp.]